MRGLAVTTRSKAPSRQMASTYAHRSQWQRGLRSILHGPRVQAKLKVGTANDPAEAGADRVADHVMRNPAPAAGASERVASPRIAESGHDIVRRQGDDGEYYGPYNEEYGNENAYFGGQQAGRGGTGGCAPPSHCAPNFCAVRPRWIEEARRAVMGDAIIATIGALGGATCERAYRTFVYGGTSSQQDYSTGAGQEFTAHPGTLRTTEYLNDAIRREIRAQYALTAPTQSISAPLPSGVAPELQAIRQSGGPHVMRFWGATNAPGLLAGGIGDNQTACPIGAQPSTQDDDRIATGGLEIDVVGRSADGTSGRVTFTPTINYQVLDTVDFCPGNCGGYLAHGLTLPLSQMEASGISGDVPFVVNFPAPPEGLTRQELLFSPGSMVWSETALDALPQNPTTNEGGDGR